MEIVEYMELNRELGESEVVTGVEFLFFDYSGPYYCTLHQLGSFQS